MKQPTKEKNEIELPDPDGDNLERQYLELCTHIGRALLLWQEVEKSHYRLFLKMLGVQASPISSVVYFSSESFDLRRRMVSRMASYFLVGRRYRKQRIEWQEIEKILKDANENRNKMAHYSAEYPLLKSTELSNGSIEFEFGEARLEPSPYNYVSKLLGRTPDKAEHSLSSIQIDGYAKSFIEVSGQLNLFAARLAEGDHRLDDGPGGAKTSPKS